MPRNSCIFVWIVVSTSRTEDVMRNVANPAQQTATGNAPMSTIRQTVQQNYSMAKNRRQTPELKQIDREWRERNPDKVLASRERSKQRHREKTGYNPEGRTCEGCHADISDRGHRAKRCAACATHPTRTCIVCGDRIRKRGPSKFCGEPCKVHDRQRKDAEGWTQVCTKCNETKEYSEFRMHYNRRDSVCKSCEAKAAQVYARALPVRERQRRRHIQGQRGEREEGQSTPRAKGNAENQGTQRSQTEAIRT